MTASASDTIPRSALPEAVVYNAIGLNLARSMGPALGGVIVAIAGALANFAVNAVASMGLVVLLWRWRPGIAHGGEGKEDPQDQPQDGLFSAIAAGVRFAWAMPQIRAALGRALLFGTAFSGLQALMPLIVHDLLAGGPALFGILSGAFGVGALGGAIASKALRKRLSAEAIIQLCSVSSAIACLAIAESSLVILTASSVALAGAAWVIGFSIYNVSIQLASPRSMGARALSLYQMAVFAGVALGSWLAGLVVECFGIATGLLALGLFGLASMAGGLILPIRAVRQ